MLHSICQARATPLCSRDQWRRPDRGLRPTSMSSARCWSSPSSSPRSHGCADRLTAAASSSSPRIFSVNAPPATDYNSFPDFESSSGTVHLGGLIVPPSMQVVLRRCSLLLLLTALAAAQSAEQRTARYLDSVRK